MNNDQRKVLLKADALLAEARELIQEVLDEEQTTYDGLSEKAQDGPKGEAMHERITSMQSAIEQIEQAESELSSARGDA